MKSSPNSGAGLRLDVGTCYEDKKATDSHRPRFPRNCCGFRHINAGRWPGVEMGACSTPGWPGYWRPACFILPTTRKVSDTLPNHPTPGHAGGTSRLVIGPQ
jgi:hypothetical protein